MNVDGDCDDIDNDDVDGDDDDAQLLSLVIILNNNADEWCRSNIVSHISMLITSIQWIPNAPKSKYSGRIVRQHIHSCKWTSDSCIVFKVGGTLTCKFFSVH